MDIKYPEKDFSTEENLRHLATHAVEGDYANLFHQGSDPANPPTMTIATAGTAVTQAVTFSRVFAQTPRVFVGVIGAQNDNTWVNAIATSVTKTGFTLVANSGIAQTLTLNWMAVGQTGG